ncbi:dTMP kinase [Candidatus Kuenenia sp.]|uniref:dTMP kinase n=1 Tax=Candidatus Kuenenia sp. TaxID=2499824 RepID=UPI00321FD23D
MAQYGECIMQGKLIVITGIDGSGKTVQTKLLYERLLKEGYPVATIDFPQYGKTFFAEMVTKYLRGGFGAADAVSPYLASILYAGDRFERKDQIQTWINEGKIIISNRYVCDNMAHQGGKIKSPEERAQFFQWLDQLEHTVFGIPRPHLSILLYVPAEIAYLLVEKKGQREYLAGAKKDIHEEDMHHMKSAQETFIEIAKGKPDWKTIDCTKNNTLLPEHVIADTIWQAVARILP